MHEKPQAAFFRAVWKDEPIAKIAIEDPSLPLDRGKDMWTWPFLACHWNFPQYDNTQMVQVNVFTNCEEAELFVNGTSMGDAHGNKLKIYYINQDKPDAPILMTTYEYDSLGRLYKYGGEGMECWIEYLPNGNYIEHHATSVYINPSSEKTNVMKEEEAFILNQEGEIAEIKGPAQHLVYSNFDRHGNWRKLKCTNKTSGTTTTTRVIEYYE